MIKFTVALIAMIAFAVPASAHRHHYRHHHSHQIILTHGQPSYGEGNTLPHPSGCPWRAFCGCGVSVRVFGHPVRDLFLASNWFRFPHAAAAAGMVAVRNHHVMYIESVDGNGNAVVYDPNSGGHQTRVHLRSLAGYSIRNPHV